MIEASSFSAPGTAPGAALADSPRAWTFSLETGRAGWMALRGEWLDLARRVPDAALPHHPAWVGAYLAHLCPDPDRLIFVTARHQGSLSAVLPLEVRSRHLHGLAFREAALVEHPHLNLADITCDGRFGARAWRAMLGWMQSGRRVGWDTLRLAPLADGSLLDWLMRTPGALPGQPPEAEPIGATAWIDCRDDPLARTSRAHRANLRRFQRRAESRGPLRYERLDTPAATAGALDHFLAVEADGWKGRAGTAIAVTGSAGVRGFYADLAAQAAPAGGCRIHLLHLGDEVIAAHFAMVTGRTVHLLKIGYREAHADLAPGMLLLRDVLDDVAGDPGLDRVSLVTDPPWAHLWAPQRAPVRQYRLFHPSWRGWLMGQAAQWRRARAESREPVSGLAPLADLRTGPSAG